MGIRYVPSDTKRPGEVILTWSANLDMDKTDEIKHETLWTVIEVDRLHSYGPVLDTLRDLSIVYMAIDL